jgi:anti-sigma factor RsiW
MHAVVLDRLEEYLAGMLEPAAQNQIELHLSSCESCRTEVAGMQEISRWMSTLKADDAPAPAPGFYARVMAQVGDRRPVPTFSSLFALDLAFGRRLAFACLLTLAVLGSYLVTRETGEPSAISPDAVMAQQDAPAFDSASAHDSMLATLTSYEP